MTSSSSAQKDKKILFSSFSKSLKKSSACCWCWNSIAKACICCCCCCCCNTCITSLCFFVQAPTEPSLAQSLLPSPVFLFRSFPAGRPRSHFQQSVLFWVVCSPQNCLFHPLSFSLVVPRLSMATFLTSFAFSLSAMSSFLFMLFLWNSSEASSFSMRYSSASSASDLVGEMPLAFSSFYIFILILSARRLYL